MDISAILTAADPWHGNAPHTSVKKRSNSSGRQQEICIDVH